MAVTELIWKAADKLRGGMDTAEYKHVLLGLLYLRYLFLEFEESRRQLGAGFVDDPDVYATVGLRWIPPAARWDMLAEKLGQPGCPAGEVLDEALHALTRSNRDFDNVFPDGLGLAGRVDDQRILELFALFGDERVIGRGVRTAGSGVGQLYEHFLHNVASIENIWVQPIPTEDATKWRIGQHFHHSINASSSDPDPQVTAPQTVNRDELLGVWDTQPHWSLTYTSPDKGALFDQGNQQRVLSAVAMDLSASSPNSKPFAEGSNVYNSSVRYDYAGPVAGKHKGTVFTKARVELVMSQKDPAVNESAVHIYDALNRPERTFPSWPGKSVPGSKEPLRRVVDPKKIEDNRKKSIKECKKVWGDYAGSGLECDEYPFASTKEGSTKGDNRFSVRLIDGKDNRKGGERLNEMYTLNRVLDGDPFYVKITN
jgi:hypothetical protein